MTEDRYITTYSNYYELGAGQIHPVERSQNVITDPLSMRIDGEEDWSATIKSTDEDDDDEEEF